jgi:carboxymethylenebutenolidase
MSNPRRVSLRTDTIALVAATLFAMAGCARTDEAGSDEQMHDDAAPAAAAAAAAEQQGLPPGAEQAVARIASSPRHGEWAMIRSGSDSIRAWVVYPERSEPAPVVLVVHEIFGLSNWVRGVADQLAADGFIAIAPDLLTMEASVTEGPDGESNAEEARAVIRTLDAAQVHRHLRAVADWGMNLPAAQRSYGIVGYCWGGATSFAHAVASPELGAAVVYYGTSPDAGELSNVRAPVLGLYGGNDERVNATIAPADSAMTALDKTFEPHIFAGAGHGFLRQQDGAEGANMAATREAWPLTVQWFRTHLGG